MEVSVDVGDVRCCVRCCCGGDVTDGDSELGVVAFVCEKWGYAGGGVRGIVVGKFGEGEEVGPVVLLIVDVDSKVLFENLIDVFCLAIGFGVIGCGKIRLDFEQVA